MAADTQRLIDHASYYARNGYKLVPCQLSESGGRKAVKFQVSQWADNTGLERLTPEQIEHWVRCRGTNAFLGVHPNTIVIDFDSAETLEIGRQWSAAIGRSPRTRVKTGQGEHWYFLNDGSVKSKCHLPKVDVQVGAANGGVFVAGSWHPVAKEHYEITYSNKKGDSTIGVSDIDALRAHISPVESKTPETGTSAPADGKRARFSKKYIDEADWSEGARNITLNQVSYQAVRLGRNDLLHHARLRALEAGLTEKEIEATQKSAKEGAIRSVLALDEPVRYSYEWCELEPLSNHDAYSLKYVFDANGIEYRYNVRNHRTELKHGGGVWRAVNDRIVKQMATEIARKYAWRTPSGQLRPLKYSLSGFLEELLAIVADSEVDPFTDDYLAALPPWDKVNRIEAVLSDLYDTEQTALVVWASRYIFLGSIQRAYEPGCKLDEMPVLYGKQGIGKSTLLASVLPQGRSYDEMFTDQIDFQARHKELIEAITGRVIVECQEMRGATKTDHAKIKAFLTSRNDNSIRTAYARHAESRPRRCIFVGTTDRSDALPNDPAGNRRFVFVRLGSESTSVETFFDDPAGGGYDYRAQCWAEALHRYRAGERANLPRELMPEQKRINAHHRSANEVLEDVIEKHLQDLLAVSPDGNTAPVGALYNRCRDEMPGIKQYQIRNYLTMCGYESERHYVDGVQVRVWLMPPTMG